MARSGRGPPERKRRPGRGATSFKLHDNGNSASSTKSGLAAQFHPNFAGMRLRRWREFRRGKLVGLADLTLPAIGLAVDNCPVFAGVHGGFCVLPSRALVDERGQQKRDPEGRLAFEPFARWSSRALADAFSFSVIELIRRTYGPEALEITKQSSHRPRQAGLASQGAFDFESLR